MQIGFMGLLFLLFLGLKLGEIIDWSWWWVTAPLWGGLAIAAAIMAFVAIGVAIVSVFGRK